MKKFKLNFNCCLLTAVVCISSFTFAGTTVIDFNACTNSSSCNIFSLADQGSNTLCNGVKIYSYIGSPVYYTQSGKRAILLQGKYSFPSVSGDGFSIEYPFKANHSYAITITTSAGPNATPVGNYAQCQLSLETAAPASVDHCNIGSTSTSGNYILGSSLQANSNTAIPTSYFSQNRSSDYSYLRVRSYGLNGYSTTTDMLVYKIEITETKLHFSFPSSFTVTCQNPTSNTFTVSNPNGVYGTLSYSWNVGAGWIYNGTPTPTTITSSSNSITLSTNAEAINQPQNVYVSVFVNGIFYAGYICNITFATPRPGAWVNGPATICSSSTTYTLANIPANSYVSSWVKTDNSNLVTLASNGNSCTLTPNAGTLNGQIALMAILQTPCGAFGYVLAIDKGKLPAPTAISSTIDDLNHIPLYSYVEITAEGPSSGNIFSYYWAVGAGQIVSGQGTQTIGVYVNGQGGNNFSAAVQAVNGCGKGPALVLSGTIGNFFAGEKIFDGDKSSPDLIIYPNPANNIINIHNNNLTANKIIQITNLLGSVIRTYQLAPYEEQLNINDLANGVYLVKVITAGEVITKKITKL